MGLGTGLYIFIVTTSGAVLVFRGEIQRLVYPQFFQVLDSRSPRIAMAEAVGNIHAVYPDE